MTETKFDRAALKQRQETAERYHSNLEYDKVAQAYLANRGIEMDVAERYLLGICDDLYPGRLSIPYLREPHGVIWFNYRALDGSEPKYKATGAKHLYNTVVLDQADETGEIAIAEGELDAIVATELCDVPTVAIPGATQWAGNRNWHELFAGYQRVWLLADPDDAGKNLATAIAERLPAARLVNLPNDVNDTYLRFGGIKEFMRG